MATERYEYAAADGNGWIVMPAQWAETIAAAHPEVTVWRRVQRVDGARVTHGEWHEVETPPAGGA